MTVMNRLETRLRDTRRTCWALVCLAAVIGGAPRSAPAQGTEYQIGVSDVLEI